MQERVVTIDRETHPLPANFTVFATQNPIEYEGTYPLPEAQKDRFMFKIVMRSPERADELALAARMLGNDSPEQTLHTVEACVQSEELAELKLSLNDVLIRDELVGYLVDVVRKTRSHESVLVGAGPRATQALLLASRAHAAMQQDQKDQKDGTGVVPPSVKLDPQMPGPGAPTPSGKPSNRSYDERPIPDALLAIFLVALATALVLGYLFLNKLVAISQEDDCILGHRPNCASTQSPPAR